jgi:uncharacterized protein (TIGR02145 family)
MRINLSTAQAAAVFVALLFMPSCKKEEAPPTTPPPGGGGGTILPPYLNPGLTYGTITDQDGNSYRTIQIGDQVWMAENLRTTKYRNGDPIPNVTDGPAWTQLTTGAWAHYENNASYENPYGKLYNWYAVADPRNVCPTNWHVPTDAEWTVLSDYLGGESVAGGKMKSTGTQYWAAPNTGATNASGFSGLPGGYRRDYDGTFFNTEPFFDIFDIGIGYWWSATETGNPGYAWYRGLFNDNPAVNRSIDSPAPFTPGRQGYSVRCLRADILLICNNATNNGALFAGSAASGVSSSVPYTDGIGGTHNGQTVTSTGVTGLTATLQAGNFASGSGSLIYTITGTPSAAGTASFALNIGGQNCTLNRTVYGGGIVSNPGAGVTFGGYTYATVVLGNGQEWMAENLRTTTYANGDPIPNVTDNAAWRQLTTGAWAHHENNASYENPYGKLYNWYAVADPRNVCPTNWHVPTDAELTVLSDYLGGENVAGGKMKSAGTQYWPAPNTGATNESGFSGLPGGGRNGFSSGAFYGLGNFGIWWSASESGAENAWLRLLSGNDAAIDRDYFNKRYGVSVRCLRD